MAGRAYLYDTEKRIKGKLLTEKKFFVRMTIKDHEELRQLAINAGESIQEYVFKRLFGRSSKTGRRKKIV